VVNILRDVARALAVLASERDNVLRCGIAETGKPARA
jgi:hypothetical protein